MMVTPGLLKDIRQLHTAQDDEQLTNRQREILDKITGLDDPHELWRLLVQYNALKIFVRIDSYKIRQLWRHPCIERFLDTAWERGPPATKPSDYERVAPKAWTQLGQGLILRLKIFGSQPRLLWISHILYNLVYYVLLTVFMYSPTLLVQFPHPMEIALSIIFVVPSLFPPYGTTFLGFLVIDVLFLISFIFRALAYKNYPYISIDAVTLLLNARVLISFLPLIQIINIIFLTFSFPGLQILRRLYYPTLPIAVSLFVGFFLSLHFLSDTHNTPFHTLSVMLRTVLLDVRPGSSTQYHPIATTAIYFTFAFLSLYGFWGVGIAGVGIRVIEEADWHVERVRGKAVRLLRFLPSYRTVRRRKLLAQDKALSPIPFNVPECFGILFRLHWLRRFSFSLAISPVILVWGIVLCALRCLGYMAGWLRRFAEAIVDDVQELGESDTDAEENSDESTSLTS